MANEILGSADLLKSVDENVAPGKLILPEDAKRLPVPAVLVIPDSLGGMTEVPITELWSLQHDATGSRLPGHASGGMNYQQELGDI